MSLAFPANRVAFVTKQRPASNKLLAYVAAPLLIPLGVLTIGAALAAMSVAIGLDHIKESLRS